MHVTSGFAHSEYVGGGAAADFNNDGWQDLFVIKGGNGGLRDRLYINNKDGTFSEQGTAWGLLIHRGKGATVGDYNNDGWLDLYVTSAGPITGAAAGHHKLYRNNGNGTFTEEAAAAGVNFSTPTTEDGFGACFGDYDRDGYLDLFVGGFGNGNSGNKLFRNNGDGTFTNVTATIGFFAGTPISMRSFTPTFVDFDGDLYPDMYLISDFGTSRYFRNNGNGTFTDVTFTSYTCFEENGMGGTVGDFNDDGRIDVYTTSIYTPAIGWTGNKFYLNQGGHTYSEVSASAGVHQGGYGWGTVAVDFNHDGRLDLLETNGAQWDAKYVNVQKYLWTNNGDGTFTEQAIASGITYKGQGRGLLNFDYDNDGDQDVVFFSNNEPIVLYRNDVSGPDTHWLRVFLHTAGTPGLAPNGFNTRVYATFQTPSGPKTILRYVPAGFSYLSMSELSAHFGLGTATVVTELRFLWANGVTKTLYNVAADQTLTVSSVPCTGDITGDAKVTQSDLGIVLAAFGSCEGDPGYHPGANLSPDEPGPQCIGQADLGVLLSAFGAVCDPTMP
jgi:hypothetical protein